ncbi:MAG TPA: RNA methyltransferase [Bryobacteraceae bacterium]|nr:RNA methyltransferase [Bryobacteraceae bacterium]
MHTIASPRNLLYKEIRRALARGTLTEDGCAVAETFHLLEEALRSDRQVPFVLAAESVRGTVEHHIRHLRDTRFSVVPDALFNQLATTETSQGVLALVRPPTWSMEELLRGRTCAVVLDGVQDPGNAGAIVRAAEAFGATGVLFLKGSVNPYNTKTLRASAGSLFRLPAVSGIDVDLAKAAFSQRRLDVYAAVPRASRTIQEVDFNRRCAIVIGSEGRGISEKLKSGAVEVAIPTLGVESLNAAMAATVILYEMSRQRRLATVIPS